MATIYTFHSHAQFVGNDEDKMFELIEHFFKTFSQSMFWSAGNKSTYVYTAGLMLRKAPASKIKTLINAYVLKFPEWLCASSLWYSNLPEAREALAKLTRNGPYHMYKMTAKLFLRKDRPTDEGFNELPKSHGDIEIQKTVELLARWFINGDLNCIQKVLDEKLGKFAAI